MSVSVCKVQSPSNKIDLFSDKLIFEPNQRYTFSYLKITDNNVKVIDVCCNKSYSEIACIVGELAEQSLLQEVYTTPKPGLVDLYSNGAHKDMNVVTFEKSARAIKPFFVEMTLEGMKNQSDLQKVFENIRHIGIEAEKAMYKATGGVNTHKGLIFSLGILCASVGNCIVRGLKLTAQNILFIEQLMVKKTLTDEILRLEKQTPKTHGETILKNIGITGARGEALSGYAVVWDIGIPVMLKGIEQKKDYNLVKLQTLLSYMSVIQDTNVISRTNVDTLKNTQNIAKQFLQTGGAYSESGIKKLLELDSIFIKKNISHGGCADLLAVTIFLSSVINK
jgi:triphosphoribosyl-dephospho-CoA synthase